MTDQVKKRGKVKENKMGVELDRNIHRRKRKKMRKKKPHYQMNVSIVDELDDLRPVRRMGKND